MKQGEKQRDYLIFSAAFHGQRKDFVIISAAAIRTGQHTEKMNL